MNYGMPYKGSKNKISKKIIDVLPSADCFVDLFGGGGAITHCAALSGKYKRVIYNELNSVVYKGFKMAINGEFKGENRWISREDFFKLKDTDPYVAICFSFGNNLKSYAFSPKNEPYKKALHEMCFAKTPYDRKIKYIKVLKELKNANDRLTDLQLQNLERLQNLSIECYNLSYEQVKIPTNSVIYCDIPYKNTDKYSIDFEHKAFYEWAKNQQVPVYISEYEMPSGFECVAKWDKRSTFKSAGNSRMMVEKLYKALNNR